MAESTPSKCRKPIPFKDIILFNSFVFTSKYAYKKREDVALFEIKQIYFVLNMFSV